MATQDYFARGRTTATLRSGRRPGSPRVPTGARASAGSTRAGAPRSARRSAPGTRRARSRRMVVRRPAGMQATGRSPALLGHRARRSCGSAGYWETGAGYWAGGSEGHLLGRGTDFRAATRLLPGRHRRRGPPHARSGRSVRLARRALRVVARDATDADDDGPFGPWRAVHERPRLEPCRRRRPAHGHGRDARRRGPGPRASEHDGASSVAPRRGRRRRPGAPALRRVLA